MQFFGFNIKNNDIYKWYSLNSIASIAKIDNENIFIQFTHDESIKIHVINADNDIELLTSSTEKRIKVTCESIQPIK